LGTAKTVLANGALQVTLNATFIRFTFILIC